MSTWYRRVQRAVPDAATLVVAGFFGLPLLWMLSTSVKTASEVFTAPPTILPKTITIVNYQGVLNRQFLLYLANSTIVSLGTSVICVGLSILAAYGFSRTRFPGRKVLLVAIMISQLLPLAVLLIGIYRVANALNLINTYAGLISAYLAFTLPPSIWLLRGFLTSVPVELEEAAMVDGASRLDAFLRISVPLAMPGIIATWAYALFITWQDFMFALVFMTSDERRTLPLGVLALIGEHTIDWGKLMASSVLLMVPIFVTFGFVQRYLIEGLTRGALKG